MIFLIIYSLLNFSRNVLVSFNPTTVPTQDKAIIKLIRFQLLWVVVESCSRYELSYYY